MLSVTKSTQFTQNTVLIEGVCLSTDTKPTTGIANGSTIIEINTGKTYMFDEEGSEWDEVGSGGGGGGGGGGSSTVCGMREATITVTNDSATPITSVLLNWGIYIGEVGAISGNNVPQESTTEFKIPIMDGEYCFIQAASANNESLFMGGYYDGTTCSGDITFDDENSVFVVTGDGSMNIKWIV